MSLNIGINWDKRPGAAVPGELTRLAKTERCPFPVVICLETGEKIANVVCWEIIGAMDTCVELRITVPLEFPVRMADGSNG